MILAGEEEDGQAHVSVFFMPFCSCVDAVSGLARGEASCSTTPQPNDRAQHLSLLYCFHKIPPDNEVMCRLNTAGRTRRINWKQSCGAQQIFGYFSIDPVT